MQRARWLRKAKVLVGVMATVAGISGLATEARAFEFNPGDLILVMFGNAQEYYRNLGPAASLLAPGAQTQFDLSESSLNPLSATAGVEPVQYTLLSSEGTTVFDVFINHASQKTSAEIVASQSNNGVGPLNSLITGWRENIGTTTGPGSEIVLPAIDPASWTTTFGIGGSLSGTWTGGGMQGSLGTLLTMIQGDAYVDATQERNVLSDVGKALLLANGPFNLCGGGGCTPAAVPLPTAVVLFGTGLAALVGIARRKFMA
ncbi:MAG: hypothetical protein L0H94_00835 [Nitrospira sp.]|nr:hypothetical protein [Nitrospira sp.]